MSAVLKRLIQLTDILELAAKGLEKHDLPAKKRPLSETACV